MRRRLAVLCATAAIALRELVAGPIAVPIYIEDNHAGSFYWLAEYLDLEEPCTLLQFDAHSDASGIFDSDLIRSRLRRVASRAERKRVLECWREKGTVQCFSWIEPLMPSPIAEVIWVPPDPLHDGTTASSLVNEAGDQLDGHLEAAPRAAGTFAPRYRVMSLGQLRAQLPVSRPVIATIDLDSFAGLASDERAAAFERVWSYVSELRNLRAITIAISRPYLKDEEEADALIQLALRASISLPTATIQFEPFRVVANDRSARANEYRTQKQEVPAFSITHASPALRALLLANAERISVQTEKARWRNLLDHWRREAPTLGVGIKDRQPSTDNVWRVPAADHVEVELRPEPWYAPIERVQWVVEIPRYLRCNLTATSEDEVGFAQGAPPRPRWREVTLPDSGKTFPIASLREFFDQETGCGAVRVRARVETANWIRETPAVEIRRSNGTGFRAALMEQFALPYLFGSGFMRDAKETGPETGWGADCANFLIYALRRQGARIPWSNPKQFRRHLEAIASEVELADPLSFTGEELMRGVVLHLGNHVAALMEDRPPLGKLNADDVVAHQLEGAPALITVANLLRSREKTRFDLLRVPPPLATSDLIIGGDVMLGRSVGERIKGGVDPFAGIRAELDQATTSAVNLECVVSAKGSPANGKKFHLRAPIEAASTLTNAGIDVVGVANNHADDFGSEALRDSIERLRSSGAFVAENDNVFVSSDSRFALLAIDDVAPANFDRSRIAQMIVQARAKADFVIGLVHWGEENSAIVTERQRELARWLIDHGVDVIAGSHPHCIQPLDFYRGRPIVYSLGNLVFDGAPTLASWNKGQLLKIGLGASRRPSPSLDLLPISLDNRGFPQLTPQPEVTQR